MLFILLTITNSYSYKKLENGILIQPKNYQSTGVKSLIIKVYSDDIIQIIGSPDNSQSAPTSLIVDDKKTLQTKFKINKQSKEIHLITNKLKVIINDHNGEITVKNINDEIIFQEGCRQITPGVVLQERVNHIKQSFQWADDETLYGLGQHQEGIFNWRGCYVELFQLNMRAIVPFLLSTKGYGILWDNYSYTKFNDTHFDSFFWSEVGDAINYFFIYGPDPDILIKKAMI
ncbi:MAG: DUF4968 domain-containing protein [bacterium]|nr:MAG: DUF4968 domain-containing protein [bacterium]